MLPPLLAALAVLAQSEPPFVRVELTGGLTPYNSVVYEVFFQGGTAVVTNGRDLVNQREHASRTGLMPADRLTRLAERLRALDLATLRTAPPAPVQGGVMARLLWSLDGDGGSVAVSAPDAQADPRYWQLISAVRDAVTETAGDIPFKPSFFDPGTSGALFLTTFPTARAVIDGRDTGLDTPVQGLELQQGPHKLRLVNEKHGIDREFDFKIEPGMTTLVTLDLR